MHNTRGPLPLWLWVFVGLLLGTMADTQWGDLHFQQWDNCLDLQLAATRCIYASGNPQLGYTVLGGSNTCTYLPSNATDTLIGIMNASGPTYNVTADWPLIFAQWAAHWPVRNPHFPSSAVQLLNITEQYAALIYALQEITHIPIIASKIFEYFSPNVTQPSASIAISDCLGLKQLYQGYCTPQMDEYEAANTPLTGFSGGHLGAATNVSCQCQQARDALDAIFLAGFSCLHGQDTPAEIASKPQCAMAISILQRIAPFLGNTSACLGDNRYVQLAGYISAPFLYQNGLLGTVVQFPKEPLYSVLEYLTPSLGVLPLKGATPTASSFVSVRAQQDAIPAPVFPQCDNSNQPISAFCDGVCRVCWSQGSDAPPALFATQFNNQRQSLFAGIFFNPLATSGRQINAGSLHPTALLFSLDQIPAWIGIPSMVAAPFLVFSNLEPPMALASHVGPEWPRLAWTNLLAMGIQHSSLGFQLPWKFEPSVLAFTGPIGTIPSLGEPILANASSLLYLGMPYDALEASGIQNFRASMTAFSAMIPTMPHLCQLVVTESNNTLPDALGPVTLAMPPSSGCTDAVLSLPWPEATQQLGVPVDAWIANQTEFREIHLGPMVFDVPFNLTIAHANVHNALFEAPFPVPLGYGLDLAATNLLINNPSCGRLLSQVIGDLAQALPEMPEYKDVTGTLEQRPPWADPTFTSPWPIRVDASNIMIISLDARCSSWQQTIGLTPVVQNTLVSVAGVDSIDLSKYVGPQLKALLAYDQSANSVTDPAILSVKLAQAPLGDASGVPDADLPIFQRYVGGSPTYCLAVGMPGLQLDPSSIQPGCPGVWFAGTVLPPSGGYPIGLRALHLHDPGNEAANWMAYFMTQPPPLIGISGHITVYAPTPSPPQYIAFLDCDGGLMPDIFPHDLSAMNGPWDVLDMSNCEMEGSAIALQGTQNVSSSIRFLGIPMNMWFPGSLIKAPSSPPFLGLYYRNSSKADTFQNEPCLHEAEWHGASDTQNAACGTLDAGFILPQHGMFPSCFDGVSTYTGFYDPAYQYPTLQLDLTRADPDPLLFPNRPQVPELYSQIPRSQYIPPQTTHPLTATWDGACPLTGTLLDPSLVGSPDATPEPLSAFIAFLNLRGAPKPAFTSAPCLASGGGPQLPKNYTFLIEKLGLFTAPLLADPTNQTTIVFASYPSPVGTLAFPLVIANLSASPPQATPIFYESEVFCTEGTYLAAYFGNSPLLGPVIPAGIEYHHGASTGQTLKFQTALDVQRVWLWDGSTRILSQPTNPYPLFPPAAGLQGANGTAVAWCRLALLEQATSEYAYNLLVNGTSRTVGEVPVGSGYFSNGTHYGPEPAVSFGAPQTHDTQVLSAAGLRAVSHQRLYLGGSYISMVRQLADTLTPIPDPDASQVPTFLGQHLVDQAPSDWELITNQIVGGTGVLEFLTGGIYGGVMDGHAFIQTPNGLGYVIFAKEAPSAFTYTQQLLGKCVTGTKKRSAGRAPEIHYGGTLIGKSGGSSGSSGSSGGGTSANTISVGIIASTTNTSTSNNATLTSPAPTIIPIPTLPASTCSTPPFNLGPAPVYFLQTCPVPGSIDYYTSAAMAGGYGCLCTCPPDGTTCRTNGGETVLEMCPANSNGCTASALPIMQGETVTPPITTVTSSIMPQVLTATYMPALNLVRG